MAYGTCDQHNMTNRKDGNKNKNIFQKLNTTKTRCPFFENQ